MVYAQKALDLALGCSLRLGSLIAVPNFICIPCTEELKEKLKEYVDEVTARKPGFIKVVRHNKQEGLIRSRVSGWRAATAPVVALFDAHVEFNVGWYVSCCVCFYAFGKDGFPQFRNYCRDVRKKSSKTIFRQWYIFKCQMMAVCSV